MSNSPRESQSVTVDELQGTDQNSQQNQETREQQQEIYGLNEPLEVVNDTNDF